MKIKVTWKDIKDGIKLDGAKCPVALALRRAFPNADICVTNLDIRINNKIYVINNKTLFKFIRAFDGYLDKKYVKPFSFNLNRLMFLPIWQKLDGH